MKIDELKIGQEYAVREAYTVRRAKLLHLEMRHISYGSRNRRRRVAVVELLGDASGEYRDCEPKGARIELESVSRQVLMPWAQYVERGQAIEANREAVAFILGRLGLHPARGQHVSHDIASYTVSVSLAELSKLADRADHLVELERIVHDWDERGAGDFLPLALQAWASVHDFSMLEDEDAATVVSDHLNLGVGDIR